MTDVIIHCASNHLEAVLRKFGERLAEPALKSHSHRSKNQEELRAVVWGRVEKEISRYLKKHSGDIRGIADHAFVFGEGLNDAIFMLTPVTSAAGAMQQHTFDAGELPPGPQHKYGLDFYERV